MDAWFDRRYCVICNHPPTSLSNATIPDSILETIFEESSPSVPSSSPSVPSITATNTTANQSTEAITIHFNNKALTLSLPSLSNVAVNKNVNNNANNVNNQQPQTQTTKPKTGTGPTYKCKQCFARMHLDCIESHHILTNNNNHNNNKDSDSILCPVCIGNASIITQSNYKHLEESIEEEKNLLRDWSRNECLACGDVGQLICCDLCFYEHDDETLKKLTDADYQQLFITGTIPKLDGAAQFHLKCVIEANTEFCGVYQAPDPFICPICSRQFGSNRLQSLHFFQRKRRKERENRMQEKALKAQQYIKQIGFTVDEIKKCVFCRINSDDTAQGVFFDKDNEFIGPFYDEHKRIKYWAHYQCVMWSPQVFMNESNEFENVEMEIKRSRGLTCSVCGKHGAVLGCYEKGCYSTYHYPCAVDAHCYFDHDLFAIYCPSHYFVHFMRDKTNEDGIEQDLVQGMNLQLYERARFDQSVLGKKRIARTCKATDVCNRYRNASDVWRFMMKQQRDKHSTSCSISISPSIPPEDEIDTNNNNNARYLTRAKLKEIEMNKHQEKERNKKKYRKSLMSFGGRKRSLQHYLNGGNLIGLNEEKQLSPHEIKRRKVFNLQPILINDKTTNVQIEPDHIDITELDAKYDMQSMIGGLDNAINVLKETVLLPLLYPELFKSFSLKPAKGVILYGPPGTGKTLLVRSLIKYYYAMSKAVFCSSNNSGNVSPTRAKSISISSPSKALKNPNMRYRSLADAAAVDDKNEDDAQLQKNQSLISFFSRRGPDLLSKFHGETERNLRSLFERAQALAPSIIFFDEIDGMAPIRSMKHEQVNNSVVATLLSLMDGLHDSASAKQQASKVFVIAATNRIDNLDPALRRPGRFDREIYVGLPSTQQRYKILKIHTNTWNIDCPQDEFDEYLKYIAIHETIGFSGADLKALCNESFINCIHRLCPQLRKCTEYKEEIADRLKTENVIVSMDDFKQTFAEGFDSSNVRNNISQNCAFDMKDIDDLNENAKRTLDELIQRMDIYINRCKNGGFSSVPPKAIHSFDENEDDDNNKTNYIRSMKQARLISQYNDRILICSENQNESNNRLIVAYLLHKLDIANVQYVSIPMIAAQQTRQDTYHCILNKIKLSINTGIGVIVLYDLDIWLNFYPKLIQTILVSNIKEMCRDRNTLILATSNQEWNAANCWKNQWPQSVYKYFSQFQHNFFFY